MDPKIVIAKRVAELLSHGNVVNLGIGLPTMVANHIPEGVDITFHSENGFLGLGPVPAEGQEDWELVNAGGMPSSIVPGGMFFDSATSFSIIRGGHVDATVLGAMEVDEKGNLANWKIPGKMVPGMGGAMDLVVGAKIVIISMVHTQKGKPKILKQCTLPLTAKEQVDIIVTEMALIRVTKDGLVLEELGPTATIEDVIAATEANLIISPNLKRFGTEYLN
ncbi:MAG: 3-oxoacid CoA-transferase subunit B [Tissierellia bacterium]|jgi:acetate CoA/acetoacetate CoA-transferase beta subunit|nr:3-oxoacid CoA-transferase subunit B [Tissierellia bacterium]MDD3226003.1 3-oxoacid CoA-transferase subunit B [Tissierellia bacterium]MDD3750496.1 3-oxoacid CoA-transferase subunit B [Tissierellia bacterium]MDD4045965.1 3-oxoacid CoA-transferase subunit B [Tissierellia bacterium]MDD4677839.1 3-oxoacid CoA-transferase subunit B [Tissierellia bacterium]